MQFGVTVNVGYNDCTCHHSIGPYIQMSLIGNTVIVGYNDAGRNGNLNITTENAGTGFAALETQWL